jgi:hypothetical protein
LKYFDEIINGIETIKKSIDNVIYQRPIFVNSFNNILDGVNDAVDYFKSDIDEWKNSNKNTTSSDIKADIQDILKYGLNRSGWINTLMRILSYSRNLFIKDKMEEH